MTVPSAFRKKTKQVNKTSNMKINHRTNFTIYNKTIVILGVVGACWSSAHRHPWFTGIRQCQFQTGAGPSKAASRCTPQSLGAVRLDRWIGPNDSTSAVSGCTQWTGNVTHWSRCITRSFSLVMMLTLALCHGSGCRHRSFSLVRMLSPGLSFWSGYCHTPWFLVRMLSPEVRN